MSRLAQIKTIEITGGGLGATGILPVISGSHNFINNEREVVMGSNDRVLGHKETPTSGKITAEVAFQKDYDVEQIVSAENLTVLVKLHNGAAYSVSNAVVVNPLENSEGTFTLEFQGEKPERIS